MKKVQHGGCSSSIKSTTDTCQQELDRKLLEPQIQWQVRKKMMFYTLLREESKEGSGDQNEERKLKKQLDIHIQQPNFLYCEYRVLKSRTFLGKKERKRKKYSLHVFHWRTFSGISLRSSEAFKKFCKTVFILLFSIPLR